MNKNEVGGAAKPVDDVDDDKGYYWRKQVGLRALGGVVVRVRAAAAVNLVGRGGIACSAEAVPCPVLHAHGARVLTFGGGGGGGGGGDLRTTIPC